MKSKITPEFIAWVNDFNKKHAVGLKKLATGETTKEFKSWVKKAIKEDAGILDELAQK